MISRFSSMGATMKLQRKLLMLFAAIALGAAPTVALGAAPTVALAAWCL
jgi:hypothetical protein